MNNFDVPRTDKLKYSPIDFKKGMGSGGGGGVCECVYTCVLA